MTPAVNSFDAREDEVIQQSRENRRALMNGERSPLMLAEYEAQAMLLGLWYDPADHTFNEEDVRYILDADTLELLSDKLDQARSMLCRSRRIMVAQGEIGPVDGMFRDKVVDEDGHPA